MAKKKKHGSRGAEREGDEETPVPGPAPAIAQRPFAEALKGLTAAPAPSKAAPRAAPRVAPPPKPAAPKPALQDALAGSHGYEDRAAFHQAMAGVRPLAGAAVPARRRTEPPREAPKEDRRAAAAARDAAEDAARARLDALVGGGVRFEVERDEDGVRGRRADAPASHLAALTGGGAAPEASLDLHGLRAEEAAKEVVRFLRGSHRGGKRLVLVVYGKGHHSEGGVGVLGDRVVRALTEGGAAPVVLAFATAPLRLGGEGALLVRLGLR